MENEIISENKIIEVLTTILNEEMGKVKREDFARVQFKLDELQNSINEAVRELRKLQDNIPGGLKTLTNGRVAGISNSLSSAQKLTVQLKEKIKQHKRALYAQQVEEKKK